MNTASFVLRKTYPLQQEGTEPNYKDVDSPLYIAGRTEEEVYEALGLPWFPPEIREARQEFAWAAAGKIPKLLEVTDLVGDLHMHTTASDGKASLRDMVVAAIDRGLKYVAITDHSPRVSMANGLSPERLRQQWKEIDKLSRDFDDFTILKGIECDILEKGGMDLPDDVLAEADWVIASVHYGQQQSREQITDRILGAIENPHVSIVAHPTGRLIGRREPYAVDLEAVFAGGRQTWQVDGNQRQPGAARSRRYCRRGRQTARHSDRHQQRRPQHDGPRRSSLWRSTSPSRRPDCCRRSKHAAVEHD